MNGKLAELEKDTQEVKETKGEAAVKFGRTYRLHLVFILLITIAYLV